MSGTLLAYAVEAFWLLMLGGAVRAGIRNRKGGARNDPA